MVGGEEVVWHSWRWRIPVQGQVGVRDAAGPIAGMKLSFLWEEREEGEICSETGGYSSKGNDLLLGLL